jgi:TPR repeat protein
MDAPRAKYELGLIDQAGLGVEPCPERTASLWSEAADEGYSFAELGMSYLYETGFGVSRSNRKAFEWSLKAAREGLPAAQTKVGIAYEEGIGVEKSYRDAEHWLRTSAENGDPRALFELGWMRYFGLGCDESQAEGKRLIDRALDRGAYDIINREAKISNPYSQLRLGWLYDMGWGVEQSCFRALAWYSGARFMGLKGAERFIDSLCVRMEAEANAGNVGDTSSVI